MKSISDKDMLPWKCGRALSTFVGILAEKSKFITRVHNEILSSLDFLVLDGLVNR